MTDDSDVKVHFGERRVYLLSMLMMLSGGQKELHVGIPLKIYLPGHFSAIWHYCTHTHMHTLKHCDSKPNSRPSLAVLCVLALKICRIFLKHVNGSPARPACRFVFVGLFFAFVF